MAEDGSDLVVIKRITIADCHGHSTAWKIAYADFTTAMMAFFLLLWLLGTVSDSKLRAVADYFTPTIGLMGQMGIGFQGGDGDGIEGKKHDGGSSGIIMGAPTTGTHVKMPEGTTAEMDLIDAKNFTNVQNDLYKSIHDNPDTQEFNESVKILQTPEGLKIQLLESDDRPMFVSGTTILKDHTKMLLAFISSFVRLMPNYVSIEGHTSTAADEQYEPWRLSAMRADAVRKYLVNGQIDKEQVARIVGKGDQEPYDIENPAARSNMRISIILLKNSIVPYEKRPAPEISIQ